MTTKEIVEYLTDEKLLKLFADTYSQSVFCSESGWLKEYKEILRVEILRRMKKT